MVEIQRAAASEAELSTELNRTYNKLFPYFFFLGRPIIKRLVHTTWIKKVRNRVDWPASVGLNNDLLAGPYRF